MNGLQYDITEYTAQLKKGHIQRAYKGIMTFMSGFCSYLEGRYPGYTAGALYFGYMDMTYFSFTPPELKSKKLKAAVVYLHEECRFEVWLGGVNRKVQAEYIEKLRKKEIGGYKLSQVSPGVDSIIELVLTESPDFGNPEQLKVQLEEKTIGFIHDMVSILCE